MSYRPVTLLGCGLLLCCTGCSRSPAFSAPKFDPEQAGSKAMELFDKNGDLVLDESELMASPGLRDGLATIDRDGDGAISKEELVTRIDELAGSGVAAMSVICTVTKGNRPVADAQIVFEPEPFLSDAIVTAQGTTDPAGGVDLQCSATPRGIQPGLYRVRITKSDDSIPARFNTETELGVEVSGKSRHNQTGSYNFELD